ncbi:MAG: NAD-dependent epimerase/dehydratase family protein, partial [Syntrophomonas sp.]|nr:NAD-dependent epimerase/dehydratase family protein [Syntrophomonas sp.]
MITVLVTGGAGFIASHIIDKLIAQGYRVACIDNLSSGRIENINSQAVFYNIDISDTAIGQIFKNEKPKIVIHHAAQVDVQISLAKPLNDANTNIIGSLNVFENCVRHGVKKVTYASSAAVYGEPKYLGIDENHPVDPQSCYGLSKYTPEYYLKIFSALHKLKYTVLRYANVYGPRQGEKGEGGVVSKFFLDMLKGKSPVIYGDGNQTRDFIYVTDVVNANLNAINRADGEILNISTNQGISINELYLMMSKMLDLSVKPLFGKQREGDILN